VKKSQNQKRLLTAVASILLLLYLIYVCIPLGELIILKFGNTIIYIICANFAIGTIFRTVFGIATGEAISSYLEKAKKGIK
jgi:hypothetical protein